MAWKKDEFAYQRRANIEENAANACANAGPSRKNRDFIYVQKHKPEATPQGLRAGMGRRVPIHRLKRVGWHVRAKASKTADKNHMRMHGSHTETHGKEAVQGMPIRLRIRHKWTKVRQHVADKASRVVNDANNSAINTDDAQPVRGRKRDRLRKGVREIRRRAAEGLLRRLNVDSHSSDSETHHAQAGTPRRQDDNGERSKTSLQSNEAGFPLESDKRQSNIESEGLYNWEENLSEEHRLILRGLKAKLKDVSADGGNIGKSKRKSKTEACFVVAGVALAGVAVDPTGTCLILAIIAATLGCCGVAYSNYAPFLQSLKSGFKKMEQLFGKLPLEMVNVKQQLLEWCLDRWKKSLGVSTDATRTISTRAIFTRGISTRQISSCASPHAFMGPSENEIYGFLEEKKNTMARGDGHGKRLEFY